MLNIYWVYILLCDNDTFYTGYTNDIQKRYQKHCEGRGAKYTKSFKPVKIVQQWKMESKSSAMKVERLIKKLSRNNKAKLIENPDWLFDFH